MNTRSTPTRQATAAAKTTAKQAPGFIRLQAAVNEFLGNDFPPGPHFIPWYVPINLQKGGTLVVCLFLMHYYQNYGVAAQCYTVAHGSYGLVWLLKHFVIPDPTWDKRVTFLSAVNAFLLVLGPYWLAPYLLISRIAPEPSLTRCAVAMFVYIMGVVGMMITDCYKYVTLAHKKGLITDGPFRYVRHPNYLGEMMIYGAFAAMVPHWATKAVLAWVWLQLFVPNMLMKEARMSRHAQWDDYYARTGLLLPYLPALLMGSGAAKPNGKKA